MNILTKITVFLFLFIVSTEIIHSQTTIFGINIGGNMSYHVISGQQTENTKSRQGFSLGTFLELNVGKMFKVVPEINFVLKGSKIYHTINSNNVSETQTKLYYISIPVNTKFGISINNDLFAFVLAGPRADITIDENENGLNGIYMNSNNINFGACLGLGITYSGIKSRLFGIEFRYNPDFGFSKYSVEKYTYSGITTNFASGTEFKNESLELIMKIGFR